ncbi:MAG TPA: sugar ABC transporter substrate-binding protein [Chloroflexota bacterium]|nr:sugar ABC transporter substrate-binding protein [Chloroflexota bacterium]
MRQPKQPSHTRRQLLSAASLLAVPAGLTACTLGGARPGQSGQPGAGSVAASGTVVYYNWGNAFSDGIEQKVVDAFHAKHDKIKVEFVNSQADHFIKLTAAIAGGDPPDTALVDGYDIRALIKRGGALDVTARMQRDGIKKEDYIESWFDEFLYRGKYHYHPNMRGSTASLFYNKDLLERVGAKVPAEGWTLTDWLEISQRATRDSRGLAPTQAGFDVSSATFGTERPGLWWPFLWVNGAELIDLDKDVCTLDSQVAIDSLQFLQDLVHKHKVTRNSFPGVPGAADLFVQGRLAIVHQWFTEIPRYRAEITNFEWDTMVMAQGSLRKQVGLYKGNGEVIPNGAKNPDAAWAFMKFLGDYDAMLIYGVEGRFVPALKRANQAPEFLRSGKPPKNLGTFTDSRVKTLPLMPEWNDFNRDIWTPNLNRIWNNEAPAKEVAPEIARLTTEFIRGRERY